MEPEMGWDPQVSVCPECSATFQHSGACQTHTSPAAVATAAAYGSNRHLANHHCRLAVGCNICAHKEQAIYLDVAVILYTIPYS